MDVRPVFWMLGESRLPHNPSELFSMVKYFLCVFRCSNYNNSISKYGALRLFRLLLAYMDKVQPEGKQHAQDVNRQLASPAAMAPFQSPPPCSSSMATSAFSLPSSSSAPSSAGSVTVDDSPRKKCRRSALRQSRLRNSGRREWPNLVLL